MEKEKIIAVMEGRGFTFNIETKDGEGFTELRFLSVPIYDMYRKHTIQGQPGMPLMPPFECTIYPDTGAYLFTYVVPGSLNRLEAGECGSYEDMGHFDRMCAKFEKCVQALYSVANCWERGTNI